MLQFWMDKIVFFLGMDKIDFRDKWFWYALMPSSKIDFASNIDSNLKLIFMVFVLWSDTHFYFKII
jgi:hypothetical protein